MRALIGRFPESHAKTAFFRSRRALWRAAAHFVPFLITPSTSTRSVRSIRRVPFVAGEDL